MRCMPMRDVCSWDIDLWEMHACETYTSTILCLQDKMPRDGYLIKAPSASNELKASPHVIEGWGWMYTPKSGETLRSIA